MYKKTFELLLKTMKDCVESTKKVYSSIDNKDTFKTLYDEIMEYEIVVKEYSKYDRDTINQIIINHIEEDSTELEDLYEDFMDEVNDYVEENSSEEEEIEFWNDPSLVYAAVQRNKKIIDNLLNDKSESIKRNQIESTSHFDNESHIRSIDDFVEDKDLQSFDELNK